MEPTPAPLDPTAHPERLHRGGDCAIMGRGARQGVKTSTGQAVEKVSPEVG